MPRGTRQRELSPASSFADSSILFNFLSAGLYENITALLKCINDIEKHLIREHNHYTVPTGPNYKRVRVLNYGMRTFVISNG